MLVAAAAAAVAAALAVAVAVGPAEQQQLVLQHGRQQHLFFFLCWTEIVSIRVFLVSCVGV